MKVTTEVIIIGGGLAGLSLALSLNKRGIKCIVLEQNSIGFGASGAPLALINPAAAKQANLAWNAEECMLSIERNLVFVSDQTGQSFYKKSGLLRPATDDKNLLAFKSSLERHRFPAGWAHWLTGEQVDQLNPDCKHNGGALWINEAYTVDVPIYLSAIKQILENDGVLFIDRIAEYKLIQFQDGKWLVNSDMLEIKSDHIVHCIGSNTALESDWNWLPVHQIKGQMSLYHTSNTIQWNYSIAANGYIAHLDHHHWAVGSTFEHHFKDIKPDVWGLNYLERKVDIILPSLRSESTLVKRWAGIRLGTPDRLPIVGRHPLLNGRWIFSGLGSKGLFYSAYIAEEVAKCICDSNYDLPDQIDIKRYYKHYRN